LAFVVVVGVEGQIPIPNRYDGFSVGDSDSQILFEAFFDLLCPYSAQAWPNIVDVVNYYDPDVVNYNGAVTIKKTSTTPTKIRFTMHTFPLPYHHNAFYAAQGAHAVHAVKPNYFWAYVDSMFAGQAAFEDDVTFNKSASQVQSDMADFVASHNIISRNDFLNGLNNATLNDNARISWKYGCSRGVAWTPAFFVNGISVVADPTWTVADWRILLDPLLASPAPPSPSSSSPSSPSSGCPLSTVVARARLVRESQLPNNGSCPGTQQECVYKPGKKQCCLPGETCVPNVGCRC